NTVRIVPRRMFKNGRQGRAAVFRVQIDSAGRQRSMCEQGPAEVELSPDHDVHLPFDLPRDDLAEQRLLREVLGAHDDVGIGSAGRKRQQAQAGESFRESHSSPSSATIAIRAAGIAPASTVGVSTMEMPRKMKTPNPPPPIAAAIVAVPMVATVARRSPATIEGIASGNSTSRRIWRSVIPMATADSRTAGSTPRIPSRVLRKTGRSA